jgi:peptidoglycan/xylan/chitin deacetylase (PgdA/CDA1 family)
MLVSRYRDFARKTIIKEVHCKYFSSRDRRFHVVLVSITFDDGGENQYTSFFPILVKFGLRGTFYVVTSWIGKKGILNWNHLAKLYSYGNEIGSHTYSHRNLVFLPRDELDFELYTSLTSLRRFDCKTLAYPYGAYNRQVIDCAKKYYLGGRGCFDINDRFLVSPHLNGSYFLCGLVTEGSYKFGTVPLINLPLQEFAKEIAKLVKEDSQGWIIFVLHGQQVTTKVVLGNLKKTFVDSRSNLINQIKLSLREGIASANSLKNFSWLCEYIAKNDNLENVTVSDGIKKVYG